MHHSGIFHEYLVNGKPIDFFLLSRILSALFTLIVTFAEIIYDVALPSAKDGLCRFHVALLGLPHLIFLLNLLLSLVDCYQTRENKVTISPFSILALNLLVALVVNWIYVSGWAPLTCAYHKIHLATLVTVLFVLFIPCAVLIVILQMKNKDKRRRQRLSDSKTVAVSRLFSTRRPTHQVID